MSESQINDPVHSEIPPTKDTSSIVVEINEKGLRKLEAHLANLREQYSKFADRERHRLGPNATSGPPKAIFREEFEIRDGYYSTQDVIKELLERNEFRIRPIVDPETGMIEKIETEATDKSRKRWSSTNSPQNFIELIEILGLEQIPAGSPIQELILRPNFPQSISRPKRRELPQLK